MERVLIGFVLTAMPCLAWAAPDVTAEQVVGAMQAAEGGPEAVLAAFADVYDTVYLRDLTQGQDPVTTGVDAAASFGVALDLWQDEQPVATVACAGYGAADMARLTGEYANDASRFGDAVRLPLAQGAGRRVVCSFQLWGDGAQVAAFEAGVKAWGAAEIAMLTPDPAPQAAVRFAAVDQALMPAGAPWAVMLWPVEQGPEAQTVFAIMFDVRADAS